MFSPVHDLASELVLVLKDSIPMEGGQRAIAPDQLWQRLGSAIALAGHSGATWPAFLARAMGKLQVAVPPVAVSHKLAVLREYAECCWGDLRTVCSNDMPAVIAGAQVANKEKRGLAHDRLTLGTVEEFKASLPAPRKATDMAPRADYAHLGIKIRLTFTALENLHHGEGVQGNTAMLRRQRTTHPATGHVVATPYVSSGSIRRALREATFGLAVDKMGIEPGSLTPEVVDLMLRGGMMGGGDLPQAESEGGKKAKKAGIQAGNLLRQRDFGEFWPMGDLLGYASGNAIRAGLAKVAHAHLVCSENAWRLPADLQDHEAAKQNAGAFEDTVFGVRIPFGGRGEIRRYIGEVGDEARAFAPMPFEWEVLRPGSMLYSEIMLPPGTPTMKRAALQAALLAWGGGGECRLGAKTATGHGTSTMQIKWSSDAPTTDDVEAYYAHLRDKREAILGALRETA